MEIIDEAKNIVLIGLMGTGKSAIGRTIGKKLGRRFIDTDRFIERKLGKTIPELFEQEGEVRFRLIEKEIIKDNGIIWIDKEENLFNRDFTNIWDPKIKV